MSDLRTAAQQALEALEDVDGPITALLGSLLGSPDADAPGAKVRTAITALRTALTQQTEPAEPVGWNWMLDGQPYGQAYYGNPPDTDIAERAAIAGRTVRLLYTAPPQRQPLTDAALWGMWVDSPSDVLRFARAVERAHGIKE